MFRIDSGMAGFQQENLFDPAAYITGFNGEVKKVVVLPHEGPFGIGSVAVGIPIILGAEGQAEEISPQILQ